MSSSGYCTTVDKKGRITIPVKMREAIGLVEDDGIERKVELVLRDNEIAIKPSPTVFSILSLTSHPIDAINFIIKSNAQIKSIRQMPDSRYEIEYRSANVPLLPKIYVTLQAYDKLIEKTKAEIKLIDVGKIEYKSQDRVIILDVAGQIVSFDNVSMTLYSFIAWANDKSIVFETSAFEYDSLADSIARASELKCNMIMEGDKIKLVGTLDNVIAFGKDVAVKPYYEARA